MKKFVVWVLWQCWLLGGANVFADVVTLKDGRQIPGQIESHDGEYVRIRVGDKLEVVARDRVVSLEFGPVVAYVPPQDHPPVPAERQSLTLPIGTQIAVRTIDPIDSNKIDTGSKNKPGLFDLSHEYVGSLDDAITVNGVEVVPVNTNAFLRVTQIAKPKLSHPWEQVSLSISVVGFSINGERVDVNTQSVESRSGKLAKRSATGALIGAVSCGALGAVVAGPWGAVTGAGACGFLGGVAGGMFKKEVKIPAEIRYTYTLAQPVAISYQPSPLQPGPDRPVLARSVTPLKYPSTYISAKNPKNRLDLNPGNSFSLLEDGQTSSGAFALNANTLELNFSTGIKTQLTIQDGRVTAPDGQSWALREESPAPAPQTVTPVAPLQYPATYVSAKNPKDELQLNADNSFSLQEDGQTYRGPFALDGNVLQLNISPDTKTPMIIQAGRLTAPDGQTWALREQTLAAAPVERNEEIVKNADVIEMSKARLEDATIIAKIRSSRCQFDTSTKALIQMRQSGVSAAVVNAVMTASK